MSDRAASLAALRPSRSTALPPPPTLSRPRQTHDDPPVSDRRAAELAEGEPPSVVEAGDAAAPPSVTGVEDSGAVAAPAAGRRTRSAAAKDGPAARSTVAESSTPIRSGFDRLIADPVDACRTMGMLREGQPSKPLNVDLTPDVASRFDDRCRALRVKKRTSSSFCCGPGSIRAGRRPAPAQAVQEAGLAGAIPGAGPGPSKPIRSGGEAPCAHV